MITTEKLVPEIYKESRDFRVFLKLLDLIFQTIKYDIDDWTTLYDPLKCPDKFLQLLSDFVGYRYDNKLSVTENRIIISEFNSLIKNKGSEIGLRLAAALSLNAQLASDPSSKEYIQSVDRLQFLELFYNYESGIIYMYYPDDLKKVRDLFKYVRPVGSFIELVDTEFPEPSSDFAISARATVDKKSFTDFSYDDNAINKAQINLSQINRGDSTDSNNFGRTRNNYKIVKSANYTYSIDSIKRLKDLMINCDYDANLDLDGDGKLTNNDINLLRELLLGIISLNDINK